MSDSNEPTDTNDIINNRFYHCYQAWNGLNCVRTQDSVVPPVYKNTRIFHIPKYVPTILDPFIIKFKAMPDRIRILN